MTQKIDIGTGKIVTFLPMGGSKRILLIEDSIDLQYLMKQLLESEGFSVHHCGNGQEALNHLEQTEILPDLILLDLMMPIMDGYKFRVKQAENLKIKGIPTVVMSAEGDLKNTRARINATDYIKKPVSVDELLEVIRKHLV